MDGTLVVRTLPDPSQERQGPLHTNRPRAGWRQRLLEALRPGRTAHELREELESHLEYEVTRQIREGAPRDDARRRAVLRAGNLGSAHEAVGDERTGRVIGDALGDLRMAARAVRRNPGFAAAVIVSLALGVGGTTAVFAVVNAVLLRPLPYADPDRLFVVRVWWNDFSARLPPADILALADEGRGVASVGAFFQPDDGFAMKTAAGPELVQGAIVTDTLPAVLGVAPIVGAGFSAQPSAPEALIGESLWKERYQGSQIAIGAAIVLDGDAYTITGVMPAGFNVPAQRDGAVWLKAPARQPTRRGPFYFYTVARLAPAMPAGIAAERLTTAVSRVLRDRYGVEPNWRYGLQPLQETLVGDLRRTLLLLLGAMGLVLVIAVVNVANLLLARGTVRARELAVRAALHDPAALAVIGMLLGSAALVACAVPALRTALIDPAAVLREE